MGWWCWGGLLTLQLSALVGGEEGGMSFKGRGGMREKEVERTHVACLDIEGEGRKSRDPGGLLRKEGGCLLTEKAAGTLGL